MVNSLWYDKLMDFSKLMALLYTFQQEYIIEKEGEYPTSLWHCVTTLSQVHDLCNNIHKLEVSQFAVCGHASKYLHPLEHHYSNYSCYVM